MYKISELIGKQTITLSDAGLAGVILGAYFDKALTKCRGFSLLSSDDENTYFVDFKDFSSLLGDAAVVSSAACLKEAPDAQLAPSPINLPAFNQDGKALGIIRDIVMNNADAASFLTDDGEIPAGMLLSRSGSIVVFNDTGTPLKVKAAAKKEKTAKTAALSVQSSAAATGAAAANATAATAAANAQAVQGAGKADTPATPFGRLRPNDNNLDLRRQRELFLNKYSFLLGKRLQRSIYTNSGRLIAKENELVTERIIGLAKESGKLAAVALHSL